MRTPLELTALITRLTVLTRRGEEGSAAPAAFSSSSGNTAFTLEATTYVPTDAALAAAASARAIYTNSLGLTSKKNSALECIAQSNATPQSSIISSHLALATNGCLAEKQRERETKRERERVLKRMV